MVGNRGTTNAFSTRYILVGNTNIGAIATATLPIGEDYPIYSFDSMHIPDLECFDFTEEKECNESERVICKGTSTRRELKKLPNRTGYKARKEFWR